MNRFLLKKVDVSDVGINGKGAYTKAKVSLGFEEYERAGKAEEKKSGGEKKKTEKAVKKRENINAIVANASTINRKGVVKE